MTGKPFTTETGRTARVIRLEGVRHDETFERANPPGLYPCPHCGETLSGPPREYQCPNRPMGEGRAAA